MSGTAKYVNIRDEIKYKILSGELKNGERVPSEAELCELYQVSRISAKRALGELENDGYVSRKVGKGTFVSFDPIIHRIGGYYSLSGEIRKSGHRPYSRLVCFEKLKVRDCIYFDTIGLRRYLELQDQDEVYHVMCKRYREEELVALDNTYIPVKYCPEIKEWELEGDSSIYRIITQKYHYGQIRAWERYFARTVNDMEAQYLGVTPGSPTMKVLRVCLADGKAMIYNWRVFRGETIHLEADLGVRPEDVEGL